MTSIKTFIAITAAASLFTAGAQTIKDRKEDQQKRIALGVASGQLTPGETKKIEGQEQRLNKEIAKDRAANGGKLTPAERAQVNHQQNKLSKEIYAGKHNARTDNFKGEVGARQQNQQQRIAQGIASGQLTPGETRKLEGQQQRINREVRTGRAANGGTLTNGEKKQINHQQNQASRKIYREKHDAAKQ